MLSVEFVQKYQPSPNLGAALTSWNLLPDPDVDALWRAALPLDLESRSVLEAEVLMWRICTARSLSVDAITRSTNAEP
jgi:hypothetical protein